MAMEREQNDMEGEGRVRQLTIEKTILLTLAVLSNIGLLYSTRQLFGLAGSLFVVGSIILVVCVFRSLLIRDHPVARWLMGKFSTTLRAGGRFYLGWLLGVGMIGAATILVAFDIGQAHFIRKDISDSHSVIPIAELYSSNNPRAFSRSSNQTPALAVKHQWLQELFAAKAEQHKQDNGGTTPPVHTVGYLFVSDPIDGLYTSFSTSVGVRSPFAIKSAIAFAIEDISKNARGTFKDVKSRVAAGEQSVQFQVKSPGSHSRIVALVFLCGDDASVVLPSNTSEILATNNFVID